ncbi:ribonuclease III [Lacihabitans sp. CS3-21]|jgi:ribonuclease-3|uniref:ribonuclease III n=1 Tax=Lacihabitans sp. CS3-21 TaxID=2487332 RepID=UPI000BD31352|nr:ribonuclease III [Lacihabitans sp. CS3-21]MCF8326067.1 ribonuclease III [Leadbetterella sp.]MCP9745300.1 ribonuclease III [Lacihabitans sp. CS3-21]MDP1814965.1 ribonuclease III [Leadbetterella sp.]OYU67802.1 MAG: ribonuclease III [Cytophagaceae bacterium BCCC1]
MEFGKSILGFLTKDPKQKEFIKSIEQIIGASPKNKLLYQLAFRHTSASKHNGINSFKESNERLEFLGDSVLGMVVAEYLFKKYPFKDEGFLTEIRSRIVNRESLNVLARRIGLDKLIEFDGQRNFHRTSMFGDAMEALIGAIYLDKGFAFTKKFIISKLLSNHFDLDEVISNNTNYKSTILSWAQADGRKVEFLIVEEKGKNHSKEFIAQVLVDAQVISSGSGWNKKKAEQDASRRACEILSI